MATVSKAIAATIIRCNGVYPGDEDSHFGPVVRVVRYTDQGGREAFGIVYEAEMRGEPGRLFRYDEQSDYIGSPVVIWRHSEYMIDGHAVIGNAEDVLSIND